MPYPLIAAAGIGAAAGLVGGLLRDRSGEQAANRNADMQREFAQQGIRWKVADARAAGIHPLYALGASTHMASPVYAGSSMGDSLANAGQDISRAWEATRTQQERHQELADKEFVARVNSNSDRQVILEDRAIAQSRLAMQDAREQERHQSQLLNDSVQRDYWASQIARNGTARGPGMPESAAAPVGAIKHVPSEVTSRQPGSPQRVAGSEPMFLRTEVAPGQFVDVPNPKVNLDSEIVHSIVGARAYYEKWMHEYRNRARTLRQVQSSPTMLHEQPSYQRRGVERRGR